MKFELKFLEKLKIAVKPIGGPVEDFSVSKYRPLKHKLKRGEFLVLGKDLTLNDIRPNKEGFLMYEGIPVMLYIPDQGSKRNVQQVLQNNIYENSEFIGAKKVHFFECKTIERMRSLGYYNRYDEITIMENKTKKIEKYYVKSCMDGSSTFPIYAKEGKFYSNKGDAKLAPCINCLSTQQTYKKKYLEIPIWGLGKKKKLKNFSYTEFFSPFLNQSSTPK